MAGCLGGGHGGLRGRSRRGEKAGKGREGGKMVGKVEEKAKCINKKERSLFTNKGGRENKTKAWE